MSLRLALASGSFIVALAATLTAQEAATHQPVDGLIQRLLPSKAASFTCETIPAADGRDVFELESFLAGPPYLPFQWMGCLDSHGGPLPASLIEKRADLQRKILARQRHLRLPPLQAGAHWPGLSLPVINRSCCLDGLPGACIRDFRRR